MKKKICALILALLLIEKGIYPSENKLRAEEWITIFVHGTVMPYISLKNMIKIIQDDIDYSTYKLTTEFIRNDPLFHWTQPIQEMGLHKIRFSHPGVPLASKLFADIYDKVDALNATKPTRTTYYTYGWSGLLSHSHRLKEAETFYEQIKELKQTYHAEKRMPKLRIVTYSHGGNLTLNLAAVARKCKEEKPFVIDQLLMVGVPIQPVTDHLITSGIFKRIYHFYSLSDHVQRLDFAGRRFAGRDNFNVPRKMTQIKIRMFGVQSSKEGTEYRKRRMDPGHIELWFFGWTPRLYRRKFPLYPLPTSVLLPWIINCIEQDCSVKDSLEISFDLNKNQVIIKNYRSNYQPMKKEVPFIPLTKLEEFKQQALEVKPDKQEYSLELHAQRKRRARTQAAYYKRMYTRQEHK